MQQRTKPIEQAQEWRPLTPKNGPVTEERSQHYNLHTTARLGNIREADGDGGTASEAPRISPHQVHYCLNVP